MKAASAVAAIAIAAAAALYLLFANGSGTSRGASPVIPTRTSTAVVPTPTPLPRTWMDGLRSSTGGKALQISCLDRNGDQRLNAADGYDLAGLDIPLVPAKACVDADRRRDFYTGPPSDASRYTCAARKPPVLLVAVASAGSNLLDPAAGESMGVLQMIDALQQRTARAGIATDAILAISAVWGADFPQTRMEQWLEHEISRQLDALPCLRAVIIGHSHGGTAVTSVTAALDARYASRLYGVTIDRTIVLYDRAATELPAKTRVFNVYQTNEGWHGVAIDLPNFQNVDASQERAPIAPSDGGGGLALVSHKTLDDSPAVQKRIEDAVMAWLASAH